MATKQKDGDYAVDARGNFVESSVNDELLQRIFACLKVKKGSFPLDKGLGSELFTLDFNSCGDDTLKVYIAEALACIDEVVVVGVKRGVNVGVDTPSLIVELVVENKSIIVEV